MKKTRKIISLLLSILMIITTISALSITSAAAYYESEPNDSISTADSISTNSTVYGESKYDKDFYKFTLSSQGYITVSINHNQFSAHSLWFYLYDSNGEIIHQWTFYQNYETNLSGNIGLPAGTYYIQLYNENSNLLKYDFTVNFTKSDNWESEPNDSFTNSDDISVNKSYNGVINRINATYDVDYYKFDLSSQGYITITMNHKQLDSEYWKVCLYDNNMNEMYYWRFDSKYASNATEKIGLPAGKYYIAVFGSSAVVGVDYTFKVDYTQSAYWETETNNTRATADNILTNTIYHGVVHTNGPSAYYDGNESDYYKFNLSSQANVSITMSCEQVCDGEWRIELLDGNGDRIKKWTFYGKHSSISTEALKLNTDNYYVVITSDIDAGNVDYSFIVEQPLFPDVRSGDWYFNAVKFNAEKGYVTGYQNGTFGPSNNIQRQDFVLILARIAGADLSAYEGQNGGFSDVPTNAYYSAAVAWAKDKGIVTGYSADNFGVGTYITREQISLILCRYLNGSASGNVDAILNAYSDGGNTSPWAKAGVAWAVENGIIGNSDYLNPNGNAGRAEVAQIIYNMSNKGML